MILKHHNFGLSAIARRNAGIDSEYDNLFGAVKRVKQKLQDHHQEKKDRRDVRKQRKSDKKDEKQQKRELANERRRLKNEMKAAKVDEKKSQTAAFNNQMQQQPPLPPAPADNTVIIVAAVGVVGLAIAGFVFIKNRKPIQEATIRQLPNLSNQSGPVTRQAA